MGRCSKVACGGDTGVFAHGGNVREMELMLEAGLPTGDVLTSVTLHEWEACGGDKCGRRFGSLEDEQLPTLLHWILIRGQTSALFGRSPSG